jgi:hypothetical protein
MKVPPAPRASSQLNSAVRALPTCRWPVGLGANLTRTIKLYHEAAKDTKNTKHSYPTSLPQEDLRELRDLRDFVAM